ncbi:Vacuolar membrane-associated protein [Venturia inaequalis]|nr:Vacuolar membrane-associated protein [Venturia inaequalis]
MADYTDALLVRAASTSPESYESDGTRRKSVLGEDHSLKEWLFTYSKLGSPGVDMGR